MTFVHISWRECVGTCTCGSRGLALFFFFFFFAHICLCVFLAGGLAGCHVAHLLLSSCLTLGLSWISLGPRWQWSRQHHFASCHMGRLQGNGGRISLPGAARLVMAHERAGARTHADGVSALQTPAYSIRTEPNKHIKRRRRRGNLKHVDACCGRVFFLREEVQTYRL